MKILMGGAVTARLQISARKLKCCQVLSDQVITIPYVLSDVGKLIRIFKNLPQNKVKNVRDYQQV